MRPKPPTTYLPGQKKKTTKNISTTTTTVIKHDNNPVDYASEIHDANIETISYDACSRVYDWDAFYGEMKMMEEELGEEMMDWGMMDNMDNDVDYDYYYDYDYDTDMEKDEKIDTMKNGVDMN